MKYTQEKKHAGTDGDSDWPRVKAFHNVASKGRLGRGEVLVIVFPRRSKRRSRTLTVGLQEAARPHTVRFM